MTNTTVRSDADFMGEIIELIDGTHWTQGHLEDTCQLFANRIEDVPEKYRHTAEPVWIYYRKTQYQYWEGAVQIWEQDNFEDRERERPKLEEYATPQLMKGDLPALTEYRKRTYTEPKQIAIYYKAHFCLVGMVLKIADLNTGSEEPLYENPDEMVIERNRQQAQPWRIIDQMAREIAKRESFNLAEPIEEKEASEVIRIVENWNDNEDTTKEDVRDMCATVKGHFEQST